MVPWRIPGGFGTVFPRRRLQFSFLRRKRYPISAQNGATEQSGRIWRQIPAQNVTTEVFQAEMAPFSRAGNKKKADPKGQLHCLLFKICVITQFTYYS
jgi:hypothetical protein